MSKQQTETALTAKLGEMLSNLPEDAMKTIIAEAGERVEAELKSNAEELKGLSAADRGKREPEIRLDTIAGTLIQYAEARRRFIHWDKLGYWGDKIIQGTITVGILGGAAAIAMKVAGRPVADTDADTTANGDVTTNTNPFQTTATERPVRSAREIKSA